MKLSISVPACVHMKSNQSFRSLRSWSLSGRTVITLTRLCVHVDFEYARFEASKRNNFLNAAICEVLYVAQQNLLF